MSRDNLGDRLANLWASGISSGVLLAVALVWVTIAVIAAAVAPDERRWSFFWCTLLFFGPIGVALALIAPSRRDGR